MGTLIETQEPKVGRPDLRHIGQLIDKILRSP